MYQYESFQRQFLLTTRLNFQPDNWQKRSIGKWNLIFHPSLHVTDVVDDEGVILGWMLGYLIDLENDRIADDGFILDLENINSNEEKHQAISSKMRTWAGCYLLIIIDKDFKRVYTDPAASIPVVYSEEMGLLGSTTVMLLTEDQFEDRLDRKLVASLQVEVDGWIPFGLTAHEGVKRLLPNHFFDLEKRAAFRWWPDFEIAISNDTKATVAEIANNMRKTINILAKSWRLTVPLTAGIDSRTVLAACCDQTSILETFTLKIGAISVDEIMAKRIAKDLSLPHHSLRIDYTTDEERSAWMLRTGYSSGGSHMRQYKTMRKLSLDRAILTGLGGESSRGYLWKADDQIDDKVTPKQLLMRYDLSVTPKTLAACQSWIDGLGEIDKFTLLDVMHIECDACRVTSQIYGPDFFYQDFYPFINLRYYDLILSLPLDYRREKRMFYEIVNLFWQELNRYRINSLGAYGDVLIMLTKIWSVRRIRRKIRKMIS